MGYTYIAIEKNEEGFEFYKALWSKRGITGYMADTMTKAIEKATDIENSKSEELYFVSIVADSIDYIPQLSYLNDKATAPILVATSKFDEEEHDKALENGADFYGQYRSDPEQNINSVITAINSKTRARKQKSSTDLITCNGILLSPSHRRVFVNDKEIELTRREFDILHLMIKKPEQVFTHNQIINKVWDGEYENADKTLLWNSIKRLREKLKATPNGKQYIETVREVGYRFSLK